MEDLNAKLDELIASAERNREEWRDIRMTLEASLAEITKGNPESAAN